MERKSYQFLAEASSLEDMVKLLNIQGIFSKNIQVIMISTVLRSYALLSRLRGNDAIPFELNSFIKLLKKYKENGEFDLEFKEAFTKAFTESYRTLFRQYNESIEKRHCNY